MIYRMQRWWSDLPLASQWRYGTALTFAIIALIFVAAANRAF